MGTRGWRVERRKSLISHHDVCWLGGPNSGLLHFGLVFSSGLDLQVFNMKSDQQQQGSGKQAAIEVVADYEDLCGEGPLWDDILSIPVERVQA
ncbi:MAG: hypothetical protein DMG99_01055 [Acidobacteria bacterium]|nr:MAG: hypothetical protein DMG99_01055 [Acidobacteriota bacterium]